MQGARRDAPRATSNEMRSERRSQGSRSRRALARCSAWIEKGRRRRATTASPIAANKATSGKEPSVERGSAVSCALDAEPGRPLPPTITGSASAPRTGTADECTRTRGMTVHARLGAPSAPRALLRGGNHLSLRVRDTPQLPLASHAGEGRARSTRLDGLRSAARDADVVDQQIPRAGIGGRGQFAAATHEPSSPSMLLMMSACGVPFGMPHATPQVWPSTL